MRPPFGILIVGCVALGACSGRSKHELLGEADSQLWSLDSVQGGGRHEYIRFHRDGTFENYVLQRDDSLHAIEYGDVLHCMTYELVEEDSIRFDCDGYHIESLGNGRMIWSDHSGRLFYFSKASEYPVAKPEDRTGVSFP